MGLIKIFLKKYSLPVKSLDTISSAVFRCCCFFVFLGTYYIVDTGDIKVNERATHCIKHKEVVKDRIPGGSVIILRVMTLPRAKDFLSV